MSIKDEYMDIAQKPIKEKLDEHIESDKPLFKQNIDITEKLDILLGDDVKKSILMFTEQIEEKLKKSKEDPIKQQLYSILNLIMRKQLSSKDLNHRLYLSSIEILVQAGLYSDNPEDAIFILGKARHLSAWKPKTVNEAMLYRDDNETDFIYEDEEN